jgi:uncharacterized membrane protein
VPDGFWYAVKRRVLGPPLVTEQLTNERLSKPLALGVLSCDGLSSAAYGTEEILYALLPFFGLAAFTLVLPMTLLADCPDRRLAHAAAQLAAAEAAVPGTYVTCVLVQGRLRTAEVRPAKHSSMLACEVTDSTGDLAAVFYGRTHIAGLEPGRRIRLHGAVGIGDDGRPAMVNPRYELLV